MLHLSHMDLSHLFNKIFQVEQLNMRQLQYDLAMSIWGTADPIYLFYDPVVNSTLDRSARSYAHKQQIDSLRLDNV